MKKQFRDKWVRALRSGRYKQTNEELGTTRGSNKHHCCLGVLLRSCGTKQDIDYLNHKSTLDEVDENGECSRDYEKLSLSQLKRFGIKDATQKKLISMNDEKGMSFKQIAAYIMRNL